MNSPFSQLNVKDSDLNRVQSNVASAFNQAFNQFGFPVGTVVLFGGPSTISVPSGSGVRSVANDQGSWLVCNGRSINTESGQALFSVIGFTYGGSVTLGTFSLPQSSNFGASGTLLIKSL